MVCPLNPQQSDLSLPSKEAEKSLKEKKETRVTDSVAKNTRLEPGKSLVDKASDPPQDLPEYLLKMIPSDEQWKMIREHFISELTKGGKMTREQAKKSLNL